MAIVKIEGAEMDLDDAICKTDKSLKDALVPYYPAAANATIKRETKDGETVITVTKQAGTKGSHGVVVAALDESPETIAPVLLIEQCGWKRSSRADVDQALLAMLEDEKEMELTVNALSNSTSEAARTVPVGF